jgi:predicted TPR repeat methyltransferase
MINTSYDEIAFRWTAERNRSEVSRLIVALAEELLPNGRILDLGCGSGIPIAIYLQKYGWSITGVDISARMIELARENLGDRATLIQADITEFDSTEEFHGIVAWDSLFHVPMTQQRATLEKIMRLLAKGGWFLFTHAGTEGEFECDMLGKRLYYAGISPEILRGWLLDMGCEIEFFAVDYREADMTKGRVAVVRK